MTAFFVDRYLPNRVWGSTNLGHYYENFFESSFDVVEKRAFRLPKILTNILAWQDVCFKNTFPDFLQDALVNSHATLGKTAMFTRDGRWRQFESHSCSQMEPPHIHMYRALGYKLFFPSLERQASTIYNHAINHTTYVTY